MNWDVDALAARDLRLSGQIRGWVRGTAMRRAATVLAHSGDSLLWLGGAGAAWFLGAGVGRVVSLRIVGVMLVAGACSSLAKALIRRPRPDGARGRFYSNLDRHAFPSGHATRVGALVMALSPWLPWPGRVLFAGWAVAVCLSRVALGLHFVSDVAGGLVLGAVLGGGWAFLFG